MKKLTGMFILTLLVGILAANAQCCNKALAGLTKTTACCSDSVEASSVKAYYFHSTRRCVTCEAVESVTRDALKEYYGNQVEFASINQEKESDNPLVRKYKISGQTLLIIKGEQVVDLTNDAFLNARTKPEKLKNKIKSTIDNLP